MKCMTSLRISRTSLNALTNSTRSTGQWNRCQWVSRSDDAIFLGQAEVARGLDSPGLFLGVDGVGELLRFEMSG